MRINIPNLALFKRSIMLDSRSSFTYITRASLLGLVLLTLYFVSYKMPFAQNARGLNFFRFVMYLNLAFLSIAVVYYFSNMIGEEKDSGMLGLTLMTGISTLSFLANKYGSRMVLVLFIVLAQVPFTILAVTLGGISLSQILAAYFSLIAFLLMISAIASFCAVIGRSSQVAGISAVIIIALFYTVPYLLKWLCGILYSLNNDLYYLYNISSSFNFIFSKLSIFTSYRDILLANSSKVLFNFQFYSNMVISIVILFITCLIFPKAIHRQLVGGAKKRSRKKFKKTVASKMKHKKMCRVWNHLNAIQWKDFYYSGGGIAGVCYRCLFYLFVPAAMTALGFINSADFIDEFLGIYPRVVFITGILALPIELTYLFNSLFSNEIKDKTYQTLTLLPFTLKTLILKKIQGVSYLLIPWLCNMIWGYLLFLIIDRGEMPPIEPLGFYFLYAFLYVSILLLCSTRVRNGAFIISLLITVGVGVLFRIITKLFWRSNWEYFHYNSKYHIIYMCLLFIGLAAVLILAFLWMNGKKKKEFIRYLTYGSIGIYTCCLLIGYYSIPYRGFFKVSRYVELSGLICLAPVILFLFYHQLRKIQGA